MMYERILVGMPHEPSMATKREVGTLCQAWAFLDSVSDDLLHGLVAPSPDTLQILDAKMEMRSKWEAIKATAKRKLPAASFEEVKALAKLVETVSGDRNVIVHGIVVAEPPLLKPYWIVWKGANAGKRFAVSTEAVRVVRMNVQKVADRVGRFLSQHGYRHQRPPFDGEVQTGWPKPL